MKKKANYSYSPLGDFTKLLQIMRLTIFLITVCSLSVNASVFSQSKKVSLDMKNATIRTIFDELEKQGGFKFFYIDEQIDVNRKVDLVLNDKQIEDVLNTLFSKDHVKYKVFENNLVVLTPGAAQQITVSGIVTDASTGDALPGVSISIEGISKGTITDLDGKFSLDLPSSNAILVFSYMGYITQRISYAGQSGLEVKLEPDIKKLDEVVVVGYGTVKRSDLTGAVARVSDKDLEERPFQNAMQAMQGKVAGVDIGSNIRPGEVGTIIIRGTRTFKTGEARDPLYVVDGIIMMGTINDINPKDIASIDILKDASATAIYGSRGANGVILITTKKGTKGKLTVNYDGSTTFDNISSITQWASAGEALDRQRLAEINGGTYPLLYPDPTADLTKFGNNDYYTKAAIKQAYQWDQSGNLVVRNSTPEEIAKGYPAQVPLYNSANIPTTDWTDLVTRTGVTQNHLLSLSAGSDKSTTYFSLGYLDNKGTQKNQNYKRYTVKLNSDVTPLKWLSSGISLNGTLSQQKYGTINRTGSATGAQDAYGMALSQYRMAQPYDSTGSMILYPGNNLAAPTWNPLIDLNNTDDERKIFNMQGSFYSEVKFTPWLKYRINFGAGFRYQRNGAFQGSQSTLRRTAASPTSAANYSTEDNFNYMVENLLYVDKTFNNHTIGITLLQSAQSNRRENSFINASSIIYDSPEWYNQKANLNGKPDDYGTGYRKNTLESFMGRVNYSFMNKYLLTASGRYDQASVLSEKHNGEFFPSFAVAWKMQEESFLKPIKWISELKLRLGYGVVGNSSIEPYTTAGGLVQYNYVYNNTPAIGFIPYNSPNPYLEWERTAQTNIGLDFGALANRITLSLNLYQSNTSDVLMDQTIPAITGYPIITSNVGKVKNRGIEISISSVNIQTRNFTWSTDLSWSRNKEEIVELVNGKQDMLGNGWFIGQPIEDLRNFRSYVVDGLWQNTEEDLAQIALWKANGYNFAPGQYKPVEQGTPNYKLEDNDKVILGSSRPKWVGGLTNSFRYKNFELTSFIYARVGQSYFSSLQPAGSAGGSFVSYIRHVDINDFWSPDNPNAKWPQPTTKAVSADVARAKFVNDGSYVIVRNIGISYTLPAKLLSKVYAKNFQVYAQVLNPFLFGGDVVKAGINPDDSNGWTNYNSVGDPTGGANNNTLMIRSWVLGLRVGF